MRPLTEKHIVLATHNAGKIPELQAFLDPHGIRVSSALELNLPDVEETGTTFQENSILKATACMKTSGCVSLGDDSGLCIAALDGQPGIYSARWAGPNKDFTQARDRIYKELSDRQFIESESPIHAYFICALALAWPDGHIETFEGCVEGTLIFPGRGKQGFGYDPIFQVAGDSRTVGEMTAADKRKISHRTRALESFTKIIP